MTGGPAARSLDDLAIAVDPRDNVFVAKTHVAANSVVLVNGSALSVSGPVTPGNRFAARDIAAGDFVRQYGQPIGTSRGIKAGDPVVPANMSNSIPVVRDLPADLANPPPDYIPEDQRASFAGYRRPSGRVGTRNMILVVPTSMCSSHEATQIALRAEQTLWSAERYPETGGVVAIPHNKGCGCADGSNLEVVLRTLRNCADHPNVGGVVFIDLGCEKTNLELLDRYLERAGGLSWDKPSSWLSIQDLGGTEAAIKRGVEVVADMLPVVDAAVRTICPVSDLVLGVKCGGSDGFSGLSANPALGHAADLLVRSGGTVLITEVPEFCGAEHVFAHRARDCEVGRAVYELVDWYKSYAAKFGAVLGENPSPGNIEGGLLNIAIKSLGAIAKAGTTRVEGVCGYAEPPSGRGLHLMQGPGYDQESTPGLVAAGATAVVFTTGRGTTIGNAIAPVIKLASNTKVFERMPHDIDLNAGRILDGTATLEDIGCEVFERLVAVAGGDPSLAEVNKHREFQFWAEEHVSL